MNSILTFKSNEMDFFYKRTTTHTMYRYINDKVSFKINILFCIVRSDACSLNSLLVWVFLITCLIPHSKKRQEPNMIRNTKPHATILSSMLQVKYAQKHHARTRNWISFYHLKSFLLFFALLFFFIFLLFYFLFFLIQCECLCWFFFHLLRNFPIFVFSCKYGKFVRHTRKLTDSAAINLFRRWNH